MKTFKLPVLLCFDSVIFFFSALIMLGHATGKYSNSLKWVTTGDLFENTFGDTPQTSPIFHDVFPQFMEFLCWLSIATQCRGKKLLPQNEYKTRCDLAHAIRTISFPGREKIWDSWSVSSSNYSRRWELSVHIKQSRRQSLQQLGKLG